MAASLALIGHANAGGPTPPEALPAPVEQTGPAGLTADQRTFDSESESLHGQLTYAEQFHPKFKSPHTGANSLTAARNGESTTDLTIFGGIRLWRGAAFYVNPEIDQGFGLSDTLGVAGFPSGAAYKVGQSKPYLRLQRAFLRQRFDLGGESQIISDGPNEVGGAVSADNITVTVGKFSVVDVFDNNTYAHDPRADFMN